MAKRPVFIPNTTGTKLVRVVDIDFNWIPGMSLGQAHKRVVSFHQAIQSKLAIRRVLEISSKSLDGLGIALSAFNLQFIFRNGLKTSVESAYQGGKKFLGGGPFPDLLSMPSIVAKRDPRLKSTGSLIGFVGQDGDWQLNPPTAFYDWLYISALLQSPHLSSQLTEFDGFTDIAFNPAKSLNCQARAAALFVSLHRLGTLNQVMQNRDIFIQTIQNSIVGTTDSTLF